MADEYGPYADAINQDTEWQHGTAVIRLTPGSFHTDPEDTAFYINDGAYIHANSGHVNVGPSKIRFHKTYHYMRLYAPGVHVGAVIITGDETTAKHGLRLGGSGGNNRINISAYWPDGTKLRFANATEYNSIAESGHNLWISWHWPSLRGSGGPSRIDQLITQNAAQQAELDELRARVEGLESYHPILTFDETEFK